MRKFAPNLYDLEISTDKIDAIHFANDTNTVYMYFYDTTKQMITVKDCADPHRIAFEIIKELNKNGAL